MFLIVSRINSGQCMVERAGSQLTPTQNEGVVCSTSGVP